jgi:endonuclease/exonuclease/phosphatase family metal-dependent hydrolase
MFGTNQKCQVMNALVALLMQAAQRFANNVPLVVAGDFNFKPSKTKSP